MLRYKCVVRFEKSGLANRTEQKKYREIALRTAAGVCSNPCAENILSACEKNGIRGLEVNILFTDDQSIRNINREYREIDSSTDVLSFPINDFSYGTGEIQPYNVDENSFLLLLGDIVVSLPAMKHQAEEYGHSVERECAFLICHGMLHLFGYDHMNEVDEQQMFAFADEILTTLQYTRTAK
ncbi:MAG: rRNA maturation RNase YbeY [Clostridiales bacterium]|nr:rRNA maturation RNase YbeY [Clostridiales bacterium]